MRRLLMWCVTLCLICGICTVPAYAKADFTVHFIDVGQADAALIQCDGHAMLIDGGNASDSSLLYSFLKNNGVTHLGYIVCTHPHADHVGGLAGALNYASADAALCPVTSYDSKGFSSFVKYLNQQDISITVPRVGDQFSLGGAQCTVLGPFRKSGGLNNRSIVLHIVYGKTSFLFTGDAEREEEQELLDNGYRLQSTVLKVGHHGSDTGTTYPFLREIMPQYAVISMGDGDADIEAVQETLRRLSDAGVTVYRTDMQGTIVCRSDGIHVSFSVERNARADTLSGLGDDPETPTKNAPEVNSHTYVLNTNTNKFHFPNCSSVAQMKDVNREIFTGSRQELIDRGYDPCGRCKP